MYYLDTSIVAPLFLQEPATSRALDWIGSKFGGELYVSAWTALEFAAVLTRLERMKLVTPTGVKNAMADFGAWRAGVNAIDCTPDDFAAARDLILHPTSKLRAPDALHLATAAAQTLTTITLDEGMLAAARKLGLPAATV